MIEGQLLKVHPDYADKLRAAGLGVDLWAGDDVRFRIEEE